MGYRLLVLVSLLCGGCAWVFQEHLPSDYEQGRREPRCSTGGGWQVLDGIFAIGNGLTAVAELATEHRTDEDNALLVGSIAWTVIHVASLSTGRGWANDCEKAQRDYDTAPSETASQRRRDIDRPPASSVPVVSDEPDPVPPTTRKVVHGAKPVYCAIELANAERGMCFLESSACADARAKTPEKYLECAQRSGSACFNATTVIDGTRLTVCSVSVKDCEAQRLQKENDPDYSNVGSQCGVYRADGEPPSLGTDKSP